MKMFFLVFLLNAFWYGIVVGNSPRAMEYTKAQEYIRVKDEVYFSFFVDEISILDRLTTEMSLDKVLGNKIYAYANKEEFDLFHQRGLTYTVLTPPGNELPIPTMSNYSNLLHQQKWNKYPTYPAYLALMEEFQKKYPNKVKIVDIGETVQKRSLLVAKVSAMVDSVSAEPNIYITSTVHGDELFGYMLCLRFIDYLCSNPDNDSRVARLIDSSVVYIAPLLNPDGTYKGGNTTVFGSSRSNANGADMNRDYPYPGFPNKGKQPETIAFKKFEKSLRFVLTADLHGGMEVALYPWHYAKVHHKDEAWYKYVARRYADRVHKNSPNGYFTKHSNGIGHGAIEQYIAKGTRLDWAPYFNLCRALTLELHNKKKLEESKLNDFWNYNIDALLDFLNQAFYGIRGRVVDSITGEGIDAMVRVKQIDDDSLHVYANRPFGDFYRPILKGTYTLIFSHSEYITKTIEHVSVENEKVTDLVVKLVPKVTVTKKIIQHTKPSPLITFKNHRISIPLPSFVNAKNSSIAVYSIDGKVMKRFFSFEGTNIEWDGTDYKGSVIKKGFYILQIQTSSMKVYQKLTLF